MKLYMYIVHVHVHVDKPQLIVHSLKDNETQLIEQGFTSAPTQYRLYGRQFLQV